MSAPGALRLLLARIGGVAGALVAGQVLLGVTYVIGARAITPATLGLVATCAAVGQVGATVLDAGLTDHTVREAAAGRVDHTRARALVRAKRLLTVPLLLAVGVVTVLVAAPSAAAGVPLALVGPAVWEAQTANGLLRAQERFSAASGGQVLGRAGGLLVALALVLAGAGVLALAVAVPASFTLEAVLDRVRLGDAAGRRAPLGDLGDRQRDALGYGLGALAASAQQLDTPLVTAGAGATAGGIYAAGGRLIGPLTFLASSLGLVAAPWLARAGNDPARLLAEERRVLRIGLVLALVPLLVAGLGPLLIPRLLGADYARSGLVFAILALGAALVTVNQPLAVIAQNRGHQGAVARAIALGLGIGLLATLGLAASGGAVLAAVGYLVSQLVIVAQLALVARRARRSAFAGPTSGR